MTVIGHEKELQRAQITRNVLHLIKEGKKAVTIQEIIEGTTLQPEDIDSKVIGWILSDLKFMHIHGDRMNELYFWILEQDAKDPITDYVTVKSFLPNKQFPLAGIRFRGKTDDPVFHHKLIDKGRTQVKGPVTLANSLANSKETGELSTGLHDEMVEYFSETYRRAVDAKPVAAPAVRKMLEE